MIYTLDETIQDFSIWEDSAERNQHLHFNNPALNNYYEGRKDGFRDVIEFIENYRDSISDESKPTIFKKQMDTASSIAEEDSYLYPKYTPTWWYFQGRKEAFDHASTIISVGGCK